MSDPELCPYHIEPRGDYRPADDLGKPRLGPTETEAMYGWYVKPLRFVVICYSAIDGQCSHRPASSSFCSFSQKFLILKTVPQTAQTLKLNVKYVCG